LATFFATIPPAVEGGVVLQITTDDQEQIDHGKQGDSEHAAYTVKDRILMSRRK
jgi:hypothetical protein